MGTKTSTRESKHLTLPELKWIRDVKKVIGNKKGFSKHVANKLCVSVGAAQKAISDIDNRIVNFGVGRDGMSQTEFDTLTKNVQLSGVASSPQKTA